MVEFVAFYEYIAMNSTQISLISNLGSFYNHFSGLSDSKIIK